MKPIRRTGAGVIRGPGMAVGLVCALMAGLAAGLSPARAQDAGAPPTADANEVTQGLAEEVYQYGISVSAVAPSVTVKTPGAEYLKLVRPQFEPVEMMAKAILLLATEPLDKVTGRVTYSQAILQEFGWIEKGQGCGINFPGSGYSQI